MAFSGVGAVKSAYVVAAGKLGLRTEQPLAPGTASENLSLSYDVFEFVV